MAASDVATPATSSSAAGGRERSWSTLTWCVATLVFLYAIGGAVFSRLERQAELQAYERHKALYQQMRDLFEFDRCHEPVFSSTDFCKNQSEFNGVLKEFLERGGTEMEDKQKWTFAGSAFYVTTLVTTLGFGNLHPTTPEGQLFTVIFGLVGIPAMGYVLSRIGEMVVQVWLPACPVALDTRRKSILVLWSLLVVLVVCGGVLFSWLEGWSLLDACYFATCTLFTVGFGDLLPSRPISRFATTLFIFAGLGVAASLVALLQIHVEIKGEVLARHLDSWYGSVTSAEGPSPSRANDVSL